MSDRSADPHPINANHNHNRSTNARGSPHRRLVRTPVIARSAASRPGTRHPPAYARGVTPELAERIVADSRDRVGWLRARSRGITATDVAHLTSHRAIDRAAWTKLRGSGFTGNVYTEHGRRREPEIAAWVAATHGILPSTALFRAVVEPRHLATPDGLRQDREGRITLAEIKTTNKPWRSIPRSYLRQVWWQQHVLGAERTLVIWEQHVDFVPVGDEPRCAWVDRDDAEIGTLVRLATALIDELHRRTHPSPARQLHRALALAD